MIARKEAGEPAMEVIFDPLEEPPSRPPWILLGGGALVLFLVGILGWQELSRTSLKPKRAPDVEVSLLPGKGEGSMVLHSQEEPSLPSPEDRTSEVLSWIVAAQKKEQTDPSSAANLYTRVVEFQPQRVKVWKTIGQLRIDAGEYSQAKQAFGIYLREFPRDVSVLGLMAGLEIRFGRPREASSLLERALQISPSASLWSSLGDCCRDLKDESQAIRAYREALQLDPEAGGVRWSLASLFESQGRFREAIEVLRGQDPLFRYHRDRLLVQSGGALARQVFKRVSSSNNPVELETIASGFHSVGKWEQARTLLDRAVARSPDSIRLRHNRGLIFFELGDWGQAENEYREALAIDPTHASSHFNLGVLFEKQEKLEKALEMYEAALQCCPDHTGAMNNIGALYLRVGKPGPARILFQKILKKSPTHADAHLNLAWALLMEQKEEEALSALLQYVSLVPSDQVESEILEKISLLEKKVLE